MKQKQNNEFNIPDTYQGYKGDKVNIYRKNESLFSGYSDQVRV